MSDTAEIIVCVVMICLFVAVTVITLVSIISNRKNRRLRIAFRDAANVTDIVRTVEGKGCTVLGIDRDEDNSGIVLHIKAPGGKNTYCSLLSDLASLDHVREIGEETEPDSGE